VSTENLKRIRELTREAKGRPAHKLTWDFRIEPETDVPVRGNAMASGDDAADAACEEWILSRLQAGEVIAWCCAIVEVKLEIGGETFTGRAHLGACSYENEADMRRDCFEAYDLKDEALQDLHQKLDAAIKCGTAAASIKGKLPVKL
jgi:hypothetical protein